MIKKAAPAAVTLLLLGGLAYNADLKQLTNQFLSLSVWSLLGTFCLLFLNQYMSSVRFHLMLGSLGHKLKFKTSFYVNVYSMVGGVFLFNFFGQSLTRSLFLKEIDPTSTSSFMITAAERAISLSILLLLASASVLVIFPDFSVALTVDGWDGIKILVGLFVVVVFVLFGVLRSQMRRMLWGILSWRLFSLISRATLATSVMHALMLSAYVALAHQLYPDISYYKLFAASSIVVLVASFPISLNGWGIRELGAAYIYGFLGISSDAGIVIGTIIGLLSLAALFTGVLISHKLGKEPVVSNLGEGQTKRMELSLYRVISRISPLCVAALVLFQIKLPTEQGLINVNLADPIAIVCGLMMAFMYFNGVFKEGIWNSSQFKLCLWAVTIIFAISFLYGYSRYGMIDWALYNRLFGWGVLLSYLLTGALIVSSAGLPGLLMLVRVFVTALAAIVFFDLSLDFIKSVSGTEILPLRHTRLAGFTGNPNAFSLQLVFALIILISFKKYITTKIVKRFDLVLLALIIAGIWLTASRAAYITSLVLIIIFALFRWVELKRMTLGFCGAVVLIVINSINFKSASILIGELIANGFTFGPNSFLTTTFGRLVHAEQMVVNEADRWESLWAGVELFLANPWFGAGLGAYMHAQLQETGVPFVIHNTPIWIGAEFGLLGLLLMTLTFTVIIRSIITEFYGRNGAAFPIAIGLILSFSIMSMPHDMFNQRTFWLILGALMARVSTKIIHLPSIVAKPPTNAASIIPQTPVRVVHLITGLTTGGAEVMLAKITRGNEHSNVHHSIISMTSGGEVRPIIEENGVDVYDLGMRRGIPDPRSLFKLIALIRVLKPDVLQTWLYHADLLGTLAAKLTGIKVLSWNIRCSDMDMAHYSPLSRLLPKLLALLSRIPTVCLINSETGQEYHQSIGYRPRNWMVLPNGFDLEKFKPNSQARKALRSSLGIKEGELVVGLVARYDPVKDLKTFFRAVRHSQNIRKDVHFVLVGSGMQTDNSELMKLATGVSNIHHLGNRSDLEKVYPGFDLMTLSSLSEGFPNVLGEAMASGVPCVATDVGACREAIGDKGWIVPTENPVALAEAWNTLFKLEPEQRHDLGLQARKRIQQYFEINSVILKYEDLYGKLAKATT